MTFNIKRGDTRQALKAQLLGVAAAIVDLSGCEVRFKMASKFKAVKKIDKIVAISVANEGRVIVVFEPLEVDVAGRYDAEFEVKYADGRIETFPNHGYIQVVIEPDI